MAEPSIPAQTSAVAIWAMTLPNGLRVWGETRPHNPTVAAHLVVGAGTRHAPRGQTGLPHFVGHMLFSGTERWPEAQLHALLRDKGGEFDGWTGYDTAGCAVQVPQRRLALALEWLAQLVFHPTFPENKLAKERQAIASERALRDPQLLRILRRLRLTEDLNLAIQTRLFGYTMEEALGDDTDLASYTRAELVDFLWQRYTPANAGLAIVGSATQEQVAALIERYFGDLPARPAPPKPPESYPKGPHQVAVYGPVERHQITLALGARTVGCAHADRRRRPLEVLEDLLGQRLLAELRFHRGLTYTPWAYNVFHRDSGYFAAQVTVADRHEEWARDTLLGEIDELTQAAPKRREVRAAARLVWANWAAADENNYERAATLADPILDWPTDQPPPDTPHLRPPQVGAGVEAEPAAVTPADINRVVRAYFVPERRFLGRHTPLFALDNLAEGFEDRLRDAKRLALLEHRSSNAKELFRAVENRCNQCEADLRYTELTSARKACYASGPTQREVNSWTSQIDLRSLRNTWSGAHPVAARRSSM